MRMRAAVLVLMVMMIGGAAAADQPHPMDPDWERWLYEQQPEPIPGAMVGPVPILAVQGYGMRCVVAYGYQKGSGMAKLEGMTPAISCVTDPDGYMGHWRPVRPPTES